jgi:hypothetical protein
MGLKKHSYQFKIITIHTFSLLMLLSLSQILPAQVAKNYTYYDTLTYRLYTQSKWDSLISTGDEAINQGIDYYYLRMRLGIANYNMEKYSPASEHFEKANEMNSNNVVLEYLYNSYLYSNDFRKALYLSKHFSDELLKKLSATRPHFFDVINVEYTNCAVNDWNNVKTENTPPTKPNNYRMEKDITGPFTSYAVNINHELSKKWSWYNSLNYFDVLSYQQLFFDNTIKHQADYHLYEYHYYTSITHWNHSTSSWSIFAHLSSINANKFSYTLLHPVLAPPPLPPITTYVYDIKPIKYSQANYLFGIQTNRFHSAYQSHFSLGYAKIIADNTLFSGYSIDYSINKNWLSGGTTLAGSFNITQKIPNGYIQQQFTFSLFHHLNFQTAFVYGKIQNIASPDGSILYNTPYQINYKFVNLLKYSLNRHASLYISYIFQNNSFVNDFFGFGSIGKRNEVIYSENKIIYKFNNQLIIGGLLWNF